MGLYGKRDHFYGGAYQAFRMDVIQVLNWLFRSIAIARIINLCRFLNYSGRVKFMGRQVPLTKEAFCRNFGVGVRTWAIGMWGNSITVDATGMGSLWCVLSGAFEDLRVLFILLMFIRSIVTW